MKKILITGMSAPQTSIRLAKRNATVAGVLSQALESCGNIVDYREPWILQDKSELAEYDSVIVGVAPLLSLSANNAYGALSIIESMYHDERLRLLVDASDPEKIIASLRSISKTPANLVKPIHSMRKGYKAVLDDDSLRSRLDNVASKMLEDWSPRTLYPAMNSVDSADVAKRVGAVAESVTAMPIDPFLIDRDATFMPSMREEFWCVDAPKSRWFQRVEHTLTWPWRPAKGHKGETDEIIVSRLKVAAGTIISPSEGGLLWWNPRVTQAMNACAIVATDWLSGRHFGESWTYLPSTMERMSQIDRFELAVTQRKEYIANTPSIEQSIETIIKELEL